MFFVREIVRDWGRLVDLSCVEGGGGGLVMGIVDELVSICWGGDIVEGLVGHDESGEGV